MSTRIISVCDICGKEVTSSLPPGWATVEIEWIQGASKQLRRLSVCDESMPSVFEALKIEQ